MTHFILLNVSVVLLLMDLHQLLVLLVIHDILDNDLFEIESLE